MNQPVGPPLCRCSPEQRAARPAPGVPVGCGTADHPREAHPDDLARAERAELADALTWAGDMLATDSRDWSTNRVDAVLWGLINGWACEEDHQHTGDLDDDHPDKNPECIDAMPELIAKHGWTAREVNLLRRGRAAIVAALAAGGR